MATIGRCPVTSPSENRQPTVLLIEDDENTRFALAGTLARAGYLVLTAPTGHDAVGLVKSEVGPIDLVVLDVLLPDVGGVDLCARLHELIPDLKVLVCSGEAWPDELARLREMGILHGYLRKPVTPAEVVTAVADALR
jgi:DNA-binding response OmpR family regulator